MTYKVRCTRPIAQEMARYEDNEICGATNRDCDSSWRDIDLILAHTTYLFTISGQPNIARWKTFGVDAQIHECPNCHEEWTTSQVYDAIGGDEDRFVVLSNLGYCPDCYSGE